VLFAEGVVEVSTFRRIPLAGEAPPPDPVTGDGAPRDLLITSDNTFGNPREDAFRRDFTVNALFYNIADFSVIDYTGGVDDLQRHLIRAIGDPDVRFQEDPVRMLRACEFAARLGFGIEHGSQEAIERQKGELRKASPARLTEELLQLLRCGKAGASLQWMLDLGLLSVLLPEAYACSPPARAGWATSAASCRRSIPSSPRAARCRRSGCSRRSCCRAFWSGDRRSRARSRDRSRASACRN
jgi:poly(A) polymerase